MTRYLLDTDARINYAMGRVTGLRMGDDGPREHLADCAVPALRHQPN